MKQPGNKESVGLIFTGVWKTIDIQRRRTNNATSRADLLQESVSVNMIMCHAFLPKVFVAIIRKTREGEKNRTWATCRRRVFFENGHFLKRSCTNVAVQKC